MASNKNLFPNLISELTRTSLISSSLFSPAPTQTRTELSPGAESSFTALTFSTKNAVTGIQFGSPSSARVTATSSSGSWTTVLKQTLSGSVNGAGHSGGLGLVAGVTGIGGLISSLSHLFSGGKSAPPPLTEFQLPETQQQVISIGGAGSPNLAGANLTYQSTQIAQAVKQALLNSSSLNDVIAEI